ncbi:acyl-CoA thioesterase domain-containing protein [Nocardia sp. NPDC057227]|uniref:acyl-CoA thioesterase domain-containing protein n=1 Tax=Nocardia sp. NPDC057227 TaxID=3346056 RepID=UPI00363D7E85
MAANRLHSSRAERQAPTARHLAVRALSTSPGEPARRGSTLAVYEGEFSPGSEPHLGQLLGQMVLAAHTACSGKSVRSIHVIRTGPARSGHPVHHVTQRRHETSHTATVTITARQRGGEVAEAVISMDTGVRMDGAAAALIAYACCTEFGGDDTAPAVNCSLWFHRPLPPGETPLPRPLGTSTDNGRIVTSGEVRTSTDSTLATFVREALLPTGS